MDEVDRAQLEIERALESALAARGRPVLTRASALVCVECGCDIAEARRLAIPGVLRCVDCEERQERRRALRC